MTDAKQMVLLIALPGAGKSTLARHMADAAAKENKSCVVCSTDDFFVVDGVYKFDPVNLFRNHTACQNKARQACADGVNKILIDNTNLMKAHRDAYETIAKDFGYVFECVVVGEFTEDFAKVCAARNLHGVPLQSILKMARRAELP